MNEAKELMKELSQLISSETSVDLVGKNTSLTIARREAGGPWLVLDNHELAETIAPVVDEHLSGQTLSPIEARQILERPLFNEILNQVRPEIRKELEEIKNEIKRFEHLPIAKLFNEHRDAIKPLTEKTAAAASRECLVRLPEEDKALQTCLKILQDYENHFKKTKLYIRVVIELFNNYEHTSDLTAESRELAENIRSNCELFQEIATKHIRLMPETPQGERIKRVFSQHPASTVEDLVQKLV